MHFCFEQLINNGIAVTVSCAKWTEDLIIMHFHSGVTTYPLQQSGCQFSLDCNFVIYFLFCQILYIRISTYVGRTVNQLLLLNYLSCDCCTVGVELICNRCFQRHMYLIFLFFTYRDEMIEPSNFCVDSFQAIFQSSSYILHHW